MQVPSSMHKNIPAWQISTEEQEEAKEEKEKAILFPTITQTFKDLGQVVKSTFKWEAKRTLID